MFMPIQSVFDLISSFQVDDRVVRDAINAMFATQHWCPQVDFDNMSDGDAIMGCVAEFDTEAEFVAAMNPLLQAAFVTYNPMYSDDEREQRNEAYAKQFDAQRRAGRC